MNKLAHQPSRGPAALKRYREKYRKKHPEKVYLSRRRYQLKAMYGITLEGYAQMEKDQKHSCAICFRESWACPKGKLHVDHDHDTKEIRGLLCSQCNTLIGLSGDSPGLLKKAASYLDSRRAA